MKVVMTVLSLLVVLGVLYGAALLGLLPAQKWADKNPALAKPLAALHLAKIKAKAPAKVAKAPAPAAPAKNDGPQQEIVRARAQLAQEKAAFEAEKQQAASTPSGTAPAASPDTAAKLVAIYDTMSPDDLVKIFTKVPDPQVVKVLMQLDEKKDGQILAALPPDRAARIHALMARSPARIATNAPPAAPATAIP